MDEANRVQAINLMGIANNHLTSAWRHLVGRRVPLAGLHRDFDKALADLRSVHEKIGEAIQLFQNRATGIE
jgi:hypothetical protein